MNKLSYWRYCLFYKFSCGKRKAHYREKIDKYRLQMLTAPLAVKEKPVVIGREGNSINISEGESQNIFILIKGQGNRVYINKIPCPGKVHIEIDGDNNNIYFKSLFVNGSVVIKCFGNNGAIKTEKININEGLHIINGANFNNIFSHNATIKIGKNLSAEYLTLWNHHSNGKIIIGDNCMFAHGVLLQNSDTHPIYNLETKEIINKPKSAVMIGNHVWLTLSTVILKGCHIPDDCIVGRNSIVTKSFDEPHCVIAGNPARIVKRNITWGHEDSNFFV